MVFFSLCAIRFETRPTATLLNAGDSEQFRYAHVSKRKVVSFQQCLIIFYADMKLCTHMSAKKTQYAAILNIN